MSFKKWIPYGILILSPLLILITVGLSVCYGAKSLDWKSVQTALVHFEQTNINHQIIIHSRLPRVIGALLVGAALAVSGTLMQGITGNYLAAPGLMGVSDGSTLAITLYMILCPNGSSWEQMMFSFLGSAFGASLVLGLGSMLPNGLAPFRLAILGSITGAFLNGVSAVLAIHYQIAQDISFWYNARLHQLGPEHLKTAAVFVMAGLGTALAIAKKVTLLSLGEEIAISLGQKTIIIKASAAIAVLVLTGTSIALAGKIGFVGLIIPHITRFLVGADYKWRIPCAAVIGGVFLGLSDVLSRFLNYPFETPVGVITTLTGVPFFLYLAGKRGKKRFG
ncbi:MAG: iron ABC transporter permease [Bacillota bacterium]|jgi:iron complex transport system permease protein